MALLNRAVGQSYETPPGGDFVRYVEQLLARQSVAAQTMDAAAIASGVQRRPAASAARHSAKLESAASTATTGATVKTSSKANELLERIRQIEGARNNKAGGGASAPSAHHVSASDTVFGATSTPATPSSNGAAKLGGWAAAIALGVIFPPLGVLMLLYTFAKNLFGNKTKP